MTVTHTDKYGKIINMAGNLSTPAGVYFTTRSNDYHGAPAFIRKLKIWLRVKVLMEYLHLFIKEPLLKMLILMDVLGYLLRI